MKSRESIVLSQYKCARLAGRGLKQVRCSTELALECKSCGHNDSNSAKISSLRKYLGGNPKLRPRDSLILIESKSKIKNERPLFSLRPHRFGNALSDTARHIPNLLDYDLSDTESFVLSHGLNFGLAPRYLRKEEIFADRKSLLTLSNSCDNRGIWPPAALSPTFAIAKSFFGTLYNTSAIIGWS